MRQLILLMSLLLISCGGDSTPKKKITYGQKSTVETKTVDENKTPFIDLSAVGIGPVESLTFADYNEELATTGKDLFGQKCTACHKIDARYIGPSLKGIYDRRNPAWVMNIMLNPTEMIKKDPIAIQLLKDYNNVVMYNQNLTLDEARALAEYFRDL
ncbi:MAG: c-type cytochrome [Flavobacteriaceae bacterium]